MSVNGTNWWKLMGPDLNGEYGAMQGVGGLEAVIREDGYLWTTINDYFGNVPADLEYNGQYFLNWSTNRVTGFGPLPGDTPPQFLPSTLLYSVSTWQGRRMDPTGFYWIGARHYDPVAGRFLSPDPAGFAGSTWDLYNYANNDPINQADPDGRFGKPLDSFGSLGNNYANRSIGSTWFDQGRLDDLNYSLSPQGQFMQAYHQTEAGMQRTWQYGIYNDNPIAASERQTRALASSVNLVTLGLANDAATAISGGYNRWVGGSPFGQDLYGNMTTPREQLASAFNVGLALAPTVAGRVGTFAGRANFFANGSGSLGKSGLLLTDDFKNLVVFQHGIGTAKPVIRDGQWLVGFDPAYWSKLNPAQRGTTFLEELAHIETLGRPGSAQHKISMWLYNNSHFARALEEGRAIYSATGDLGRAAKYGWNYNHPQLGPINRARVLGEGALFIGGSYTVGASLNR